MFYDLHIHSCLSPCGDMDMTPYNLVNMSALNGIEVIALTDHNTSKNCPAAMKAGEEAGVLVIPGMELTTAEEAHIVCLFDDVDKALAFSDYVYEKLPDVKNKSEVFGQQIIMDHEDRALGSLDKLLITATTISVMDVERIVKEHDGFCFPAHIDRNSYSIISSLGDIPPECGFITAEISKSGDDLALMDTHPILKDMRIVHSSDAHYLTDLADPIHKLNVSEATAKAVIESLKIKK